MSGATTAIAGFSYSRPVYLPPTLSVGDVNNFSLATASFTVKTDGTYSSFGSVPTNPSGTWLLSGSSSSYEVRFTTTSGTVSSGSSSTGTWLALSADRSWNKQSGFGVEQVIGTIEIRNASTLQLLISSTLTLTAAGPT